MNEWPTVHQRVSDGQAEGQADDPPRGIRHTTQSHGCIINEGQRLGGVGGGGHLEGGLCSPAAFLSFQSDWCQTGVRPVLGWWMLQEAPQ